MKNELKTTLILVVKELWMWFFGIAFTGIGMTMLLYGINPVWWPAFLNHPGVCLIWMGLFMFSANEWRHCNRLPIEES